MIGDPNWLYSTIAQSSAAIVAIIGGFITATMLMLTSERRGLKNQLTERKTRLEALKPQAEELFNTLETRRVTRYLNSITDELIKERKMPSLEEIIRRHPPPNLNEEILKSEYGKLSKQKIEARLFIEDHSDRIDSSKYLSFDEWVKENKLDLSSYNEGLVGVEYYKFRDEQREIAEQEEKSKGSAPRWLSPPALNLSTDVLRNGISTQHELYQRQKEDRRIDNLASRFQSLINETSLLEREIASLEGRLRTFSYPPNLKWGISVLAYLGVGGILIPVITIKNATYSASNQEIAIGLFASGLAAIFAYIVFLIRTMRKSRKD